MIELAKYFRILFLSPKISRERFKALCKDHIARLNANNPGGIFTAILTAVTNLYNAYFGDMASESLNQAVKEGKTTAMNKSRENLEKNISDGEKLIRYTYRDNEPFYQEFFPQGVTEYNNADLPTFGTITLRYKDVLTAHAADFPAAFKDEYDTLQGVFVANRSAQLAAKGDVAAEVSDLASSKPALAEQMTKNLLTIALQYVGDESKADVYFDQSIINAAFNGTDTVVESDLDPAETENVFDNTEKPEVTFKMEVNGDGSAFFGFAPDPETPITLVTGKEVTGDGEAEYFTAAELGFTSEKKNLNVTNSNGVMVSYRVEKV
jgi:hypothetical protein